MGWRVDLEADSQCYGSELPMGDWHMGIGMIGPHVRSKFRTGMSKLYTR